MSKADTMFEELEGKNNSLKFSELVSYLDKLGYELCIKEKDVTPKEHYYNWLKEKNNKGENKNELKRIY